MGKQAILEYDPTWYNTAYSYEKESNSSDDNNEYREPTCNDLDPDVGVGYASFDNHDEAHPIVEPSEPRYFQDVDAPFCPGYFRFVTYRVFTLFCF